MTGLLLMVAVGIWVMSLIFTIKVITKKATGKWWSWPTRALFVIILFPLPWLDEIVAKKEFERLCKEKAVVTIDASNTQGRTVWFGTSERMPIKIGSISVLQIRRNFVDTETQEPIYHYYRFEAQGGWFIHFLGISEGGKPFLFRGICEPTNLATVDLQLGLTHLNRSISNKSLDNH